MPNSNCIENIGLDLLAMAISAITKCCSKTAQQKFVLEGFSILPAIIIVVISTMYVCHSITQNILVSGIASMLFLDNYLFILERTFLKSKLDLIVAILLSLFVSVFVSASLASFVFQESMSRDTLNHPSINGLFTSIQDIGESETLTITVIIFFLAFSVILLSPIIPSPARKHYREIIKIKDEENKEIYMTTLIFNKRFIED